MRNLLTPLFILLVVISYGQTKKQTVAQHNNVKDTISKPQLKSFIDSLYIVDQQVQQNAIAVYQRTGLMDSFMVFEKIEHETFARHIPLLKKIFKVHGYPTFKKVEKETAGHYFVLIQHSDADVAFQIFMLPIIKKQVAMGQLEGKNYAYLYDRVQINSGKQQWYGTQLGYDKDGNAYSKNLKDKETVNERRAAFGLLPIEAYLQSATDLHKKQNEVH